MLCCSSECGSIWSRSCARYAQMLISNIYPKSIVIFIRSSKVCFKTTWCAKGPVTRCNFPGPPRFTKLHCTVSWLYYTICTQETQKKHTPPKVAAIRLTLLLFPLCTKPRARYQNSEPPNQRNRSSFASTSNCTHPKEISPPQYHIYVDNRSRACGKDRHAKHTCIISAWCCFESYL